jgi:hypothetical protein
VKALGEARRADLPAEHTGPRGLRRRRAILAAIVASAPPGVVAYYRPRLCVAHSASVDDIAGVAVLSLSARIKDPLPDRRSALVGRLPHRAACVNGHFWALSTAVVPCTALLAYAGHQAFSPLHGCLLDKRLRLAVQVSRLGRRGRGHGSERRRGCNELLTRAWGRVWVADVEVSVDALPGLLAQLAHAFSACGGFSSNGGTKQSHRAVLFCELSLEITRLSQLGIDVSAPRRRGGRGAWPRVPGRAHSRICGSSPSPAPATLVLSTKSPMAHEAFTRGVVAQSSRTSSPRRRGTTRTSLGPARLRSPIPRTRVRLQGGQFAGGVVVRLVVGGGDEVPDRQKLVSRKVLVRRHVGASGRSVGCRGVAHPMGEPRLGGHALPSGRLRHLADGCITLRCGARGPTSFHSRLARALARTPSVSRCRRARSVRLCGRWSVSSRRGGNRP